VHRTILKWLPLLLIAVQAAAQDFPSAPLGYGDESLPIPVPDRRNGTLPETVVLIGESMGRHEDAQRVQLTRDVGACQMSLGLKYLEIAAKDPNDLVRAESARSAGLIGDKAFLPTLTVLLGDQSLKVQREAILAGGVLGDASFATAGLKSRDSQILAAAMEAASTPEHANTIAQLLPTLTPSLQIEAMQSLARLGAASHSTLIASFADKSVPLAGASMRAIRELKAADQVDVVVKTLGAAHSTVRRDAVDALATTAEPFVQQQQAIRMLKDPDPTVRQSAAKLLQAVPLADGVAPLVEQLDDGYAPLHHDAREALVAARDDAVPAAAKLLDNPDPRRREDGSYVLGKLKSAEALQRHIALMEDPDWDVVSQVARSLGEINRQEAAPAIIKLCARSPKVHIETQGRTAEQNRINQAAIRAIADTVIAAGKLRIKEILPGLTPLIPLREQQPYQYRAAIAWAFGVMGDASDTATCERFIPIYGDLFEATEVKFEGLKALGNVGYKPAAASLLAISQTDFSPNLRWISFWSHRTLTGEPTEYVNPVTDWIADVSISALPKP
jgi:HEAT repeat protein